MFATFKITHYKRILLGGSFTGEEVSLLNPSIGASREVERLVFVKEHLLCGESQIRWHFLGLGQYVEEGEVCGKLVIYV